MPDPPLLDLPEWAQGLVMALTAALSGVGGYLTRHLRSGPVDDTGRLVKELRDAICEPEKGLGLSVPQQVAMITRYVSIPDADGNRVSMLREVLQSLAATQKTMADVLARLEAQMEARFDTLEETWGTSPRRPRVRSANRPSHNNKEE